MVRILSFTETSFIGYLLSNMKESFKAFGIGIGVSGTWMYLYDKDAATASAWDILAENTSMHKGNGFS